MPRDHSNHPTFSAGKLDSEKFIVDFCNPENQPRAGYIISVLGCPDNGAAERHVAYWKRLGYPEDHQIITDCGPATNRKLHEWARRTGFRGTVLPVGRLEEQIPVLIAAGVQITMIDADVCGVWGLWEEQMINMELRLQIPCIAFTFTQRGYSDYMERLGYRLGLITRISSGHYSTPKNKRQRPDHWSTKEVVEAHCKSLLFGTGYGISSYMSYKGAGTTAMATICIKKEDYAQASAGHGTRTTGVAQTA